MESTSNKALPRRLEHGALLWVAFFLICFGLGYPTLNRYDPSKTPATADTQRYFEAVVSGSVHNDHFDYRVMVPYMARPIYRLVVGHTGTWNPVSFSLLVVNSAFCSSSALMLVYLSIAFGLTSATGFIAGFAYLANFNVANAQLAGLVDSSETFFVTVLMFVLWRRAWNLLPIVAGVGALTKETFVPISFLFVVGWVWKEKDRPWIQIAGMVLAGMAMITAVAFLLTHRWIMPLQTAVESEAIDWLSFIRPLGSWAVWLTFIWLVPFAFLGRSMMPKAALSATLLAFLGVYAMAGWADVGGDAARPLFNAAGPCLSIAFAAGITKLFNSVP